MKVNKGGNIEDYPIWMPKSQIEFGKKAIFLSAWIAKQDGILEKCCEEFAVDGSFDSPADLEMARRNRIEKEK